jgi:hypothetical protein
MKVREDVAYFKHMDAFYAKVQNVASIKSVDIAQYSALMQLWNKIFYNNPLTVTKDAIRRLSKISHSTHSASLQRLHDAGFIVYKKGCNEKVMAEITMIRLDRGSASPIGDTTGYKVVPAAKPNSMACNAESSMAAIPNSASLIKHRNIKQNKHSMDVNKIGDVMKEFFSSEQQPLSTGKAVEANKRYGSGAVVPTREDVMQYFTGRGSNRNIAEKFFQYNENKNWGACKVDGDWVIFAERWVARNRVTGQPESRPLTFDDIQALYQSFLANKLRLVRIPSGSCAMLNLAISETVLSAAIGARRKSLEGGNGRADCLLLELYTSGKMDAPEVINDKLNLDEFAKKMAVFLYFGLLAQQGQRLVPTPQNV